MRSAISNLKEVQRAKTAIKRPELSRPVRLAIETGILTEERSLLDYGCGHGGDIRQLEQRGIRAWGWDPVLRPDGDQSPADVVNLGYVANVIEDLAERRKVLERSWDLARHALIISVRLTNELRGQRLQLFGDGYLTGKDTFQKFYTQAEARQWCEQTIGVQTTALAPGVFAAFRDEQEHHRFLASRYRRARWPAAPRISDQLFEQHKDVLVPLMEFVGERGRLPTDEEASENSRVKDVFGSLKQAFAVVRRVTGSDQWVRARSEAIDDLRVFVALDRFSGRPKLCQLPREIRQDIKAFYGAYTRACRAGDDLLFQAGDITKVAEVARTATVGKLVGETLYIHVSAIQELPPLLRVYEGCGRALVGSIADTNVVKFDLRRPRLSYLVYPDFDRKPHPALRESWLVKLRRLEISVRDYSESGNPPVLHRKELLVTSSYREHAKFARLTAQEERWGLFDTGLAIGHREGWCRALDVTGVRLVGHRLVRDGN